MPDFRVVDGVVERFNACTDECDTFNGPCACGAWHKPDEPSGFFRRGVELTMSEFFNVQKKGAIMLEYFRNEN